MLASRVVAIVSRWSDIRVPAGKRCSQRSHFRGQLLQFKARQVCDRRSSAAPRGSSTQQMKPDWTPGPNDRPQDVPDPASMRGDYSVPGAGLSESEAHPDPMQQFATWFSEAADLEHIPEANAMCIATATPEGRPSNRMVLMKGYDQRGFMFYTNYSSRKGQELQKNNFASLCFWWEPLHRSVRVEGEVQKMSAAESDTYFHSRPRGSQIGAVVSHQSSVLAHGREELELREKELQQKYADDRTIVPRPENWGGYVVIPSVIEFWHGKKSRLHDRLQYTKKGSEWKMERLSP